MQALDEYEACISHNRLVCSFESTTVGAAAEAGAAATITTYAGSYDYNQPDNTYACAANPLVEVVTLF